MDKVKLLFIEGKIYLSYRENPNKLDLFRPLKLQKNIATGLWYANSQQAKKILELCYEKGYLISVEEPELQLLLGVNKDGLTDSQQEFQDKKWINHPSYSVKDSGVNRTDFHYGEEKPFNYQWACLDFAITHNYRFLCCDPTGTGKTLEALMTIESATHIRPVAIVTISNALFQWKKHILNWINDANDENVSVMESLTDVPHGQYCIMTYKYMTENQSILEDYMGPNSFFILDEFHKIANVTSNAFNVIESLGNISQGFMGLSATPLDRIRTLYPVLNILDPIEFGSFEDFSLKYCDGYFNEKTNTLVSDGLSDYYNLIEILRNRYMIMRPKEVANIPATREEYVYLDSDSNTIKQDIEELNYYKERVNEIVINEGINDPYLIARMLNEDPKYKTVTDLFKNYKNNGDKKLPSVIQWLNKEIDNLKPCILFSHHISFAKEVYNHLEGMGYKGLYIDGKHSSKKKFEIQQEFMNDASNDFIVVTDGGGGAGLDFQRAKTSISMEFPVTVKDYIQRSGRISRVGQENESVDITLIGNSVFDKQLFNLNISKGSVSNAIVDPRKRANKNSGFDDNFIEFISTLVD
ncbi:DEAD/DEAH box helicase [Photobacterium leiognathi]|uniref:DEAD/DEAH box helicase n=1 Tax=Photobacterium leiognathi TaxID=553611 RepID=UPI0029810D28|nr:DEAD/DEAH box helicase [Photobacterium leiognathi]